MPFYKDFNEIWGKNEMKVSPYKWRPISIEYGYGYVGTLLNMFWRVKGTRHTFRIPVTQLNELSKGDYEKHIEDFLQLFREDYLGWVAQGLPTEWMQQYHQEYKNLIEI